MTAPNTVQDWCVFLWTSSRKSNYSYVGNYLGLS